ncbi:hypothetical protein [Bacteroides timonensis]|uniref:hypothetical protein n=1 Tax=Bacteroides timonensis TaxID=1470345 RepID=UPI0004AE8C57|nr:hypothetical protein [Bacteroides timonensis]
MDKFRYIASCLFTRDYPELSFRIQDYLRKNFGMDIIRCCADKYKVHEFEECMAPSIRQRWKDTTHYTPFDKDTVMVSVCHNCTAVFQESLPEVKVVSLWEFLLENATDFPFPDCKGEKMTLQDCWRSYDNTKEQEAVRALMHKMNIEIVELKENHANTHFCGISTLRPAPARNLKMAPKRFVEDAPGLFKLHTLEEQKSAMQEYCKQVQTEKVVAYCHYCTEGFRLAGQQNLHLAELLFKNLSC